MNDQGIVYLMYHELQLAGRHLCRAEKGYVRYVITQSDFGIQLSRLKESNLRGMSVGQALLEANQKPRGVALTFDDGCETDLVAAAPLLREAGFGATFYVVVSWLNRRAYLSHAQLRKLAELGFEIGCHSMTHAYLTDLDSKQLHAEIAEPKERLEHLIGQRVDHFSCPGGRWDRRVAGVAREAGYKSVATSRIGTNSPEADLFRLARVAVLRRTSLADFDRLCCAQGLLWRRAQGAIPSLAKRLVESERYERVRSYLFEHVKF